MTLDTSAERPAPVREISAAIGGWIHRLGPVWVEGQVAQFSRRPGVATVFLTLRDPVADVSLQVSCQRSVLDAVVPPLAEGARVVVQGRPRWYFTRGTLSLAATEIRAVGVGELLARLERLRGVLAAEGLFDPDRKRALPFLPREVGLICGRQSAAEHDVLENVRRRWPAVRFRIENVAVQGGLAVPEIVAALGTLDRAREVDVIVLARGGGSTEDLLAFSDESLVRAVAACRTPVVSAIGHETDTPLVDLVADVRASTPTDAAKCVVPDLVDERKRVAHARRRARAAVEARVTSQRSWLAGIRSRPALRSPSSAIIRPRQADVAAARERAHRALRHRMQRERLEIAHARERVAALSPAGTLARGYSVVQDAAGRTITSAAQARVHDPLVVRLAVGALKVQVVAIEDPHALVPTPDGQASSLTGALPGPRRRA